MESSDPYRTPAADIQPPTEGEIDFTPPYSPAGRFGRLSYIAWVTLLGIAGNLIMLAFGGGAAAFQLPVDDTGMPAAGAAPEIGMALVAVSVIVGLITLVFGIIFAIRRCHDVDISGWWSLLFLVPLVNLIYMLFLMLKRGTDGPNRFGPARTTPVWEKVVGIIGVALFVGVILLGIVGAIAVPLYMGSMETAG